MSSELILLVDDEPSIIQLARMYFERDGFRILEAGDGEAALEAIQKHKPALVVLDVMLPKLDGFDVCRRLRSNNDQTPVIMLTARDEDIDKILGLELGADDYLTKPFNPRELVATPVTWRSMSNTSRSSGDSKPKSCMASSRTIIEMCSVLSRSEGRRWMRPEGALTR